MACEDKKAAFDTAMTSATQNLKDGLNRIAQEAERKATALTDELDQGQDLAGGVGATAGAVVGGLLGGPAGAAVAGDLGKEIGKLFILKIDTQTVTWAIDVPQVTMKTQDFSFDSPVIVMKDKDMSFDLPEITMVRRRGPDKPEMTCGTRTQDLGFAKIDIPYCDMKMTPTWFDFPEVTMTTHRIVIGLPEVSMITQSFKMDVPEFTMERQELSFDIPSISLEFITDAGKKTAETAAAIAQEAKAATVQKQASMREELRLNVVGPCTDMFDCYRINLNTSRLQVLAMFDPQINQITESIKSMLGQNIPESSPELGALRQRLNEIISQRDKAIKNVDEAIQKIEKSANEAIAQFINHNPEDEKGVVNAV